MKVRMHLRVGITAVICVGPGGLQAQDNSNGLSLPPNRLALQTGPAGDQARLGGAQAVPAAPGSQSPAPVVTRVPPANYQIAADDVLDIRVFRDPDLNTVARVGNDGTIMFPLVGQLQLSGLSVVQAAKVIQSRLAAGYLPNPQVSVNITDFNHRRFTILGEVTRSGTYDFPDQKPLDLLQAIGVAGGYTNFANPSDISIKRTVNGKTSIYRVNARKLAHGKANYEVQVQPGDVITVGQGIF
jgi:protein involved in polysaccharide export with SLBB domain